MFVVVRRSVDDISVDIAVVVSSHDIYHDDDIAVVATTYTPR